VSANLLTGGIDEVFARSDSLGSFTPLQDALGSTVALVDVNGNVATQYSYDPFGNTTVAGVLSSNPAQYTGRENERNGLYFHRARYYNPVIGRFISEDPIGFAGGQENLYAYVFNNPTGFVDPYGLDAWDRLQNFSDFSNGAASVLTFGVTDQINNALGNSQFVNQCSGWHALGSVTGIGLTTAIGGAAGAEAAEANAAEDGYEFSHWIPNRYGGPRSIFNGNYVSEEFHYLTDPFRYPSGWQQFGSKLPAAAQQLLRIPWVYVGGGAGAAYGGTSAMHGRNCGCSK
jgi:RHS repeat-associated protein